jgi:hypothetical protein
MEKYLLSLKLISINDFKWKKYLLPLKLTSINVFKWKNIIYYLLN